MKFCFLYVSLEFYGHAQFNTTTPQRALRIMHYSPTLRNMPVQAMGTRTLAEGVHREDLSRSAQPRHTCLALLTLPIILPTTEGWKVNLSGM